MANENFKEEYEWDEGELIKAFEVAIKLGTTNKPEVGHSKVSIKEEITHCHYGDGCLVYDPSFDEVPAKGEDEDTEGYLDAATGVYYGDGEYENGEYEEPETAKAEYVHVQENCAYAEAGNEYSFKSEYVKGTTKNYTSGWDREETAHNYYPQTSVNDEHEDGVNSEQVKFQNDSKSRKRTPARARRCQRRQAHKGQGEEFQEEEEQEAAGEFYAPDPSFTPDWSKAFPSLTAPPLPATLNGNNVFKKGDMSSLLMTWYLCGYQAGYYDAMQDFKEKK